MVTFHYCEFHHCKMMKITTMLLKASDKNILVFYKVSHFIVYCKYDYYDIVVFPSVRIYSDTGKHNCIFH